LEQVWSHYRYCFWTQTRDQSENAYHYLSGLLRMKTARNFKEIGRIAGVPQGRMQHFMSESPWEAQQVSRQVQADIRATEALQGGALLLDESADAKAGLESAGAARQYNGRLGKVDRSQVGVFLTYVKGDIWTWIDGELFLPEAWFTAGYAERRRQVGIPEQRQFQTKVELGWEMVQRAQANQVPFEFLACDDLYGRATWFRSQLAGAAIAYMADVPSDTLVYREKPQWGIPPTPPEHHGRPFSKACVLSKEAPRKVASLTQEADPGWRKLRVRATERGFLEAEYRAWRIWTLRDEQPTEEWLLVRRMTDGSHSYALSNMPADTPLARLAEMEAQRFFVERSIQDAKSELGWAEFQARKFLAWHHHTALTILAAWFIAQTQLDWQQRFPPDPQLTQDLGVEQLPTLSYANVRTLLRAVMPLPRLSPAQARQLVAEHLLNRSRSRKSRLKKKLKRSHSRSRDPS
jgi:SRSO17 transposase